VLLQVNKDHQDLKEFKDHQDLKEFKDHKGQWVTKDK
jgi:hypothetical protein